MVLKHNKAIDPFEERQAGPDARQESPRLLFSGIHAVIMGDSDCDPDVEKRGRGFVLCNQEGPMPYPPHPPQDRSPVCLCSPSPSRIRSVLGKSTTTHDVRRTASSPTLTDQLTPATPDTTR
ncbi:uncharacterized protein FOMMEDRAFT_150720 [Fomitiporia mediterranea MF3/22]|uniref:uncharacterized protein n=1 Tax=Fomitiporia mediterranea (strain MF3/22) TaxID=694068 RepID=UPI0004407BD1|nr:uncharacterized protein FOMMEDRAFT_150720 [Fomitiporia mediterranea MF3/22]EJD08051.1 hypothetical protein FOMMEDRAFT_150720 [Fomitiporia mediterranea MF3/22]